MMDGETLFSEEIVWDPIPQQDPQWHYDHIMSLLQRAASKLPRVDAIGGSAAGVYTESGQSRLTLPRHTGGSFPITRQRPLHGDETCLGEYSL